MLSKFVRLRVLLAFAGALNQGCGGAADEPGAAESPIRSDAGERDAGGDDAASDDASATDASTSDSQAADASGEGAEPTAALRALAWPRDAALPPDPTNRYADDPKAAAFGRVLFFDPSFAGRLIDGDNDGSAAALGNRGETGKVSCAGCHVPQSYFADTRSLRQQISLAAGWGRRRSPSILDVAHSKLLMWDGRHDTLYNQVFGVIESPVEMNSSRLFAAKQIYAQHRAQYEAIFGPLPPLDDTSRFPALSAERSGCSNFDRTTRLCTGELHGLPGDKAEYDGMAPADRDAVTRVVVNMGKALGAYQRLLSCGESRFDRWVRGEDPNALTPAEQRGALLFAGKGKCIDCHSGPFFSDERFHNVGLKPELVATVFIDIDDPGASAGLAAAQADALNSKGSFSDGDDGRLPSTLEPSLLGAFRTPKLRCISKRPSFMHTGHVRTLSDVVAFFNRGGDRAGFLGKSEIAALGLSVSEREDLVAFLLSLDGPGPRAELLAP
jgi:cytochrome c peroxidase